MRTLILAFFAVAFSRAYAVIAPQEKRAGMDAAEMHLIPVEKALTYFKKHRHQADFGDKLTLTQIGRDGLGMKNVLIAGSGSDDEALAAISVGVLAQQLDGLVARNPHWAKKVSPGVMAQLKTHYELLNQTFNLKLAPSLDAWPWFLYQLGDSAEAKALLRKRFTEEKDRLMNAQENKSVAEVESLAGALKSLSSKQESDAIAADLRQVKVHVSNLPENRVMT